MKKGCVNPVCVKEKKPCGHGRVPVKGQAESSESPGFRVFRAVTAAVDVKTQVHAVGQDGHEHDKKQGNAVEGQGDVEDQPQAGNDLDDGKDDGK